jgi:hypothetical protein
MTLELRLYQLSDPGRLKDLRHMRARRDRARREAVVSFYWQAEGSPTRRGRLLKDALHAAGPFDQAHYKVPVSSLFSR